MKWDSNFFNLLKIILQYSSHTCTVEPVVTVIFAYLFCILVVKVLRMLEGDLIMDPGYMSTPGYDGGNRSGRICTEQQQCSGHLTKELEVMGGLGGKLSLDSPRPPYWERDKARRTS